MPGHAADADASALQMDEEENVLRGQSFPGVHLNGKAVHFSKQIQVRADEVLPGGLARFGRRCNAVSPQDIAHSLIGNNVAPVRQRSDDAVIPQPELSLAICTMRSVTSRLIRGRPG